VTISHYNIAQVIIRPHLTSVQLWPTVTGGVVWSACMSVSRSMYHNLEPYKNGWTNQDTVWDVGPGNH